MSSEQFEKVRGYIALAKEEGGELLLGGSTGVVAGRCANGWFIEPTVFEGLPQTCRTNTEEIFGPVVTLQRFSGIDEGLALANGVPYGLAASIWTRDLATAHGMASRIEAGIVWINCWMLRDLRTPFGGMKQSGMGREGGWEAMRFFTEAKNVCVNLI